MAAPNRGKSWFCCLLPPRLFDSMKLGEGMGSPDLHCFNGPSLTHLTTPSNRISDNRKNVANSLETDWFSPTERHKLPILLCRPKRRRVLPPSFALFSSFYLFIALSPISPFIYYWCLSPHVLSANTSCSAEDKLHNNCPINWRVHPVSLIALGSVNWNL